MRLSSDYLFHYKKSFDIFLIILERGFRHNLWSESIPYKESQQQNFICSFCDIRPREAEYHRVCYGEYAIALTKKWGISKGVSPVRYIHEQSPGVSDEYISLKNLFRGAQKHERNDTATVLKMYLISSMLYDKRFIQKGDFERSIQHDPRIVNAVEILKRWHRQKSISLIEPCKIIL